MDCVMFSHNYVKTLEQPDNLTENPYCLCDMFGQRSAV